MKAELPLTRRDIIASRLDAGQPVVAASVAAEFEVSEDAVRRDLRALAAEGRCRRVYGGALPVTPATLGMAARIDKGRDRKRRLARVGVGTIRPGELVFLDCGSTNLAMVDLLPEDPDVTVATNSVDIAAAVLRRQDVRLIVVGGMADPLIGGCVDAAAVQCVMRMRIDRAFVGACSVSAEHGIGTFHFADATFKRSVVAASRSTVVLATAETFEVLVPHHVAALDRIDVLVLEHDTDPARVSSCTLGGCRSVRLAGRD